MFTSPETSSGPFQPTDTTSGESFALLCSSQSSALAMVGAGLAQMGTPSIVVRTRPDAVDQLNRDDIRFGTAFVLMKDSEFRTREFLAFLEQHYPAIGRVVVAVNETSFETTVWAEPASPSSQSWTDGSGGATKPDWRLRFARGIGRRTDVTLI